MSAIISICTHLNVSADWLLGLPERGGSAGDGATVSLGAGNATAVSSGGDCSRCQLMAAHIREITGRGREERHA